jgi:hypothetical protein
MINKKDYPLIFLKSLEKLHQETNEIVDRNSDIIGIKNSSEFEIYLEDISEHSNFKYSIYEPNYSNGKIVYNVEFNPKNSQSLIPVKFKGELKSVIGNLEIWIKLIRSYDDIHITPKGRIINEYEKEFYNDFEILEDDADINPFDLRRQLILNNFLNQTIKILETEENENIELINEAIQLKENITKLTKKTTMKKLSKLLSKIRYKSLTLLREILEVAKKELYKKVVSGGFKMIGELIDLI